MIEIHCGVFKLKGEFNWTSLVYWVCLGDGYCFRTALYNYRRNPNKKLDEKKYFRHTEFTEVFSGPTYDLDIIKTLELRIGLIFVWKSSFKIDHKNFKNIIKTSLGSKYNPHRELRKDMLSLL